MKLREFKRLEFEYRIFISLSIVMLICIISILYFSESPSIMVLIGTNLNITPSIISKSYYIFMSVLILGVSILRMWAGSILTANRVMSFSVKSDLLIQDGPYRFAFLLQDYCCPYYFIYLTSN